MCIACHYYGDSKLVPRERREKQHKDGDHRCVRVGIGGAVCVDCHEVGVDLGHTCPVEILTERADRIRPTWYVTKDGRERNPRGAGRHIRNGRATI